jgi:hypothetical protein
MSELVIPEDLRRGYDRACEFRKLNGPLCSGYSSQTVITLIERVAQLTADLATEREKNARLMEPVSHDEIIAVQRVSGHSLNAMTYACICNLVLAARANPEPRKEAEA